MSEQNLRKVFSLPENLYASGSPIIIADSGLLKDENGEKVFLSLGLMDINAKEIDSFKVEVQAFDTIWKPVGEILELVFAELKEENLVELDKPAKDLYAVDVVVSQVVFKDGSTWENTESQWIPLRKTDIEDRSFFKPEVLEERKREFTEKNNKL